MPAKTTIFDTKANIVHNFALGPRNTILYSPHGRFVLVAGFGNLAGQVDIYDLEKDYAKVATIEGSNASVCEWSPDGKHILTATTSPRLRVDNGIRIWHVGGGLMYNEEMHELYEVKWRPQSTDKHPLENPLAPVPAPHDSALAYLGRVKTPSKPAGAYRPPGARGTVTPLHFKREDEGGAAYSASSGVSNINGFGKAKKKDVPGADPLDPLPPGAVPGGGVSLTLDATDENLSKAALKNKKKREAKKAREAEEKAAASTGAEVGSEDKPAARPNGTVQPPSGPSAQRLQHRHSSPAKASQSPSRTRGKKAAVKEATPEASFDDAATASPGSGGPEDKKVRALLKKLRAIEELKMRQAGGEKLELSQVSKINSEESVKKELEAIGYG